MSKEKQMDLLSTDVRDADQIVTDLIAHRDKITRCLKLADEIVDLINKDADRLVTDMRNAHKVGSSEVKAAMQKRNNHLSASFHSSFNTIFSNAMRNIDEPGLIVLRDSLIALEEVETGVNTGLRLIAK